MAGPEEPDTGPRTRVDHEGAELDEPATSQTDWLKRGQSIDRYLVIECLGVGGMGVIYAAWDPQLDRKLAIKVVRGRAGRRGSARARARLLREAQALARLRHPNVVAVHDIGEYEDRVFVAMEFVDGETLQRWLLRSPRPPTSQLISVFLQVGRGLAAAHRAGIVHRDIKPENVMIGEDGRVLVLDFGIAREGYGSESDVIAVDEHEDPGAPDPPTPLTAVDDEFDEFAGIDDLRSVLPQELEGHVTPLTSLTRAGAVIGTPAYMSPEQHRGQPVDSRGDQFSYCVAMWEALHGEKPFGEGGRQKLLARMRVAQVRRAHNREVPRRINKALTLGLSWHPGDRFAQMEDLLEALNPRGATAEQRLWHGLGLGALGGMAIGVVATLVGLGNAAEPSRGRGDPQSAAQSVEQRAGGHVPAEIHASLAELEAERERRHRAVDLGRLEPITHAAREAGDHRVLARAGLLEAERLRTLGRLAEAEARALEAAAAAASVGDPELEARTLLEAALTLAEHERPDEARRWLDHAAALIERLSPSDPRLAELERELGRVRERLDLPRPEGLASP